MLKLLPDLVFPVTQNQVASLMDCVVQLNVLDAGLNDRVQKALDIVLETYELKAASGTDYTGEKGHTLLTQQAMNFVGTGNPIVTRNGDLRAAHLAIAFNNTQKKLQAAGMPLLPYDVNALVALCRDFAVFPPQTEDRIDLFLGYLRKK